MSRPVAGGRSSGLLGLVDRGLAVLCGSLVVALLATVTAGIVTRAFDRPLAFTDELSGYLMVWLAASGWMLATRRGSHIRMRFFHDLLPPGLQGGLESVLQLAVALFGGVVAWKAVSLVVTNWDVEAVSIPISAVWVYAPLIPAGLATLLQGVADALHLARERAGDPEHAP